MHLVLDDYGCHSNFLPGSYPMGSQGPGLKNTFKDCWDRGSNYKVIGGSEQKPATIRKKDRKMQIHTIRFI